ncbi:hypothetical protein BGZ49_008350 [Haplosporangium sp. Z 27]|nr:hypothetical protein BGZ49_008350 [Haplosporangium sp. Z 27]
MSEINNSDQQNGSKPTNDNTQSQLTVVDYNDRHQGPNKPLPEAGQFPSFSSPRPQNFTNSPAETKSIANDNDQRFKAHVKPLDNIPFLHPRLSTPFASIFTLKQPQEATLAIPMSPNAWPLQRHESSFKRQPGFTRALKRARRDSFHQRTRPYEKPDLEQACRNWTAPHDYNGPGFSETKNPMWLTRLDSQFHENSGSIIFKPKVSNLVAKCTFTNSNLHDGEFQLENTTGLTLKNPSVNQHTTGPNKEPQMTSTTCTKSGLDLPPALFPQVPPLSKSNFVDGPFSKYANSKSSAPLLQELLKLPPAGSSGEITSVPLLQSYSLPLSQSPSSSKSHDSIRLPENHAKSKSFGSASYSGDFFSLKGLAPTNCDTSPDYQTFQPSDSTPVLDFMETATSTGIMDMDLFGACYPKAIKEVDMNKDKHEGCRRLNILVEQFLWPTRESTRVTTQPGEERADTKQDRQEQDPSTTTKIIPSNKNSHEREETSLMMKLQQEADKQVALALSKIYKKNDDGVNDSNITNHSGNTEEDGSKTCIVHGAHPSRNSIATMNVSSSSLLPSTPTPSQDSSQVSLLSTYLPSEYLDISLEDYANLISSDIDFILSDSIIGKISNNSEGKADSQDALLLSTYDFFDSVTDSGLDELPLLSSTPSQQVTPFVQEFWTTHDLQSSHARDIPKANSINEVNSLDSEKTNIGGIEEYVSREYRKRRSERETSPERLESISTLPVIKANTCLEQQILPITGTPSTSLLPRSKRETVDKTRHMEFEQITVSPEIKLRRSIRLIRSIEKSPQQSQQTHQKQGASKSNKFPRNTRDTTLPSKRRRK